MFIVSILLMFYACNTVRTALDALCFPVVRACEGSMRPSLIAPQKFLSTIDVKKFTISINNTKNAFLWEGTFKTLKKRCLQHHFGPLILKKPIKQYRTWQCGQRSTETLIM